MEEVFEIGVTLFVNRVKDAAIEAFWPRRKARLRSLCLFHGCSFAFGTAPPQCVTTTAEHTNYDPVYSSIPECAYATGWWRMRQGSPRGIPDHTRRPGRSAPPQTVVVTQSFLGLLLTAVTRFRAGYRAERLMTFHFMCFNGEPAIALRFALKCWLLYRNKSVSLW